MTKNGVLASNPVFVVGVFRSGTSLLYSLLNQHPQISLMYECNVWDFPALLKGRRFSGDWLERQEFYNHALTRHRLAWGGSRRGLEAVRTPDDLYRVYGELKGATLWGEKSPFYSTRLKQLGRQYPGATFIFIWRNPVETYRSVLLAGRKTSFFRKPGMLHRLIYSQEQLVGQSAWLEKRGAQVRHVNYDDLVDQPEAVCRSLCEHLQLKFEPAMLRLEQADFSAVYVMPQHDHLRRGVIERQKFSEDMVAPGVAQKLERFRRRWQRLAGRPLGKTAAATTPEPNFLEVQSHKTIGFGLHLGGNVKRAGFEFLPLRWLRTYRLFKHWLGAGYGSGKPVSLAREFFDNRVTVTAVLTLLVGVSFFDYMTGPEVTVGPLYLLPCGAMALIVGRRWGLITAFLCATSITLLNEEARQHFHPLLKGTIVWNASMRFIFFTIFVLLLDRIRLEINTQDRQRNKLREADGGTQE